MSLFCETISINAKCKWSPNGGLSINFVDPSYLRSDSIVYDADNQSLVAIVHQNEFLIGRIDDSLADHFEIERSVSLIAQHVNGDHLQRKVNLSVH